MAESEAVCVAVHVRPLIQQEIDEGCKECLILTHGEPEVSTGLHSFRYDYVFGGNGGEPPSLLYDNCVAPLVDGLFKGFHGTVFAYGQTGSGKTWTMGSSFTPGGSSEGVIPKVMDAIFQRISHTRDTDFIVRCGFVEIHKEEIRDLVMTDANPHPQVHIREVAGGGICLAGANEREVRTKEQMMDILQQGTLLRATAATGMNKRSSRSHAIFTITLEQRKLLPSATGNLVEPGAAGDKGSSGDESDDEGESEGDEEDGGDDCYLCAKMHLVDLAGSERAKRTKAVGQRLQEGININKGLLALGNVICALSEGKQHVPYRDSKLTRMLQDSLGGNSRTLMIACVSPADVNLEETLNTLRYANRARNIRNKPVVNRDPVAAQIAHLRQQLAAAKAENQSLKRKLGMNEDAAVSDALFGGGQDAVLAAALEELEMHNKKLGMECNRLRVESDSLKQELTETTEKMIMAQAQRDRLTQKLEQVAPEAAEEVKASLGALGAASGEADEVVSHLQRIAELEREVKRLRQVSRVSGAFVVNSRRQSLALDVQPGSPFALGNETPEGYLSDLELNDDEFAAEEQAHRHEMTRVQAQLAVLQQQLEEKEARMQVVGSHAVLRHAYDKQLKELQAEVDQLSKERAKLVQDLTSVQHASEEERLKMEVQYRNRLKDMDDKLKTLRSKEKRILELERIKVKAEEACNRLQHDIQNIKQQKVALMKQAEKAAKEFAEWKRQRDKELLQLRKQGRANAAQLQKMEALHAKQQAVLRRKTEEAEAARKRLKEMEHRRSQAVSRPGTAAASDRPTTAPAAPAALSGRPATGAALAVERSVSMSGPSSSAASSPLVDCQPNQLAPLLRDEKSRREWVEKELDACCASYDLQRVLEGEKALRSECARKLRDVEKKLAALKNPGWWPVAASPGSQSEHNLLRQKQELHKQLDAHSKQIQEYQLQLMKVKQSEEDKGGGAADARRWNGLRTIVEARAMLKTVFRSASQHKAQAYEVQLQMTEAVEEVELLRLRLDIAEQEKLESSNLAAKAQAAVAAFAAGTSAATPEAATLLQQAAKDDTDALADTLIQQLEAIPSNLELLDTIPEEEASSAASGSISASEDEVDLLEDSEEEESSDEEADQWDPAHATPCLKRKKAAAVQRAEQAVQRRPVGGSAAICHRRTSSVPTCPEEQPVLNYINAEQSSAGEPHLAKLTVPILKQCLKGKVINGQEWRAGNKKREDLVNDFRMFLGLKPVDPTSPPDSAGGAACREHQNPSLQVRLADTATPSMSPAGGSHLTCGGPNTASTTTTQGGWTPVGAEGATPDAMPTVLRHGFPPSPLHVPGAGSTAAAAAAAPPVQVPRLTLPAQSAAAEGPGSSTPGSGKASGKDGGGSSSPMQRLARALNPFASKHCRSQSDLPPVRTGGESSSGGSGGAASHSSLSQPGTPSRTTAGAAALLEKSAACMQRAAEMKTQISNMESRIKSSRGRRPASPSGWVLPTTFSPPPLPPPPSVSSPGPAAASTWAAAAAGGLGSAGSGGASSKPNSPGRLQAFSTWMGIRTRGSSTSPREKPPAAAAAAAAAGPVSEASSVATVVTLRADAASAAGAFPAAGRATPSFPSPRPLGTSNRDCGAHVGGEGSAGSLEERENLGSSSRGSSAGSADKSRPASAKSAASMDPAGSRAAGVQRHVGPTASSPNKQPLYSRSSSARREGSPPRIWK